MNVSKKILANTALFLFPFLLLEMLFRVLPVSYPPYILPVSAETPVARFQQNKDYRYSKGWNFDIVTRKHTNNYGYTNQEDYVPGEGDPLLVVIGDSYVEAQQVNEGESAAELLHTSLGGEGRVYSMGLSGAPLSQYLAFAEYAGSTFLPGGMVFVIVANDFDESLLKYSGQPRFHYFQEAGESVVLTRIDYRLSGVKRLLRRSAFVRYLMLNLEAKQKLELLLSGKNNPNDAFMGNVPAIVGKQRIVDSKQAVKEFFLQLPNRTGLDARSVLFVIDGIRPALYSDNAIEEGEKSYFGIMRKFFKDYAGKRGYEVIDMQDVFIERNRLDGSRFEFESDAHWNQLGHELVANEIRKSGLYKAVFSGK